MLSKVITEYLDERLLGQFEKIAPQEGFSPFIRFKPKWSEFGDIDLYDDGDEVTIFFGRFTHSHYRNYEDISREQKELHIAEDVFEMLNDVFNDRYEFWGSQDGMGGLQSVNYATREKQGIFTRLFGKSQRTFYRWSGVKRTIKR